VNDAACVLGVAIRAGEAHELLLSPEDREAIGGELAGEAHVLWLPAQTEKPDHTRAAFALETVLLVVASTAATALLKEVTDDAAKAVWRQTKRLVSRIWKRQSDRSYNLSPRAYVIAQHGDNYIAVQLRAPITVQGDATTQGFEGAIEEQLASLRERVSELEAEVARLPPTISTVTGRPTYFEVRRAGDGWTIIPWDAIEDLK